MRRRGATLIELLVVLSIFSFLMMSILSFYVYASQVSSSRDRMSTSYRKALTAMDKVETLLFGNQVVFADGRQIVFLRPHKTNPVGLGAWPQFESGAESLAMVDGVLVHRRAGNSYPLLQFSKGEALFFQQNGDSIVVTVVAYLPAIRGGQERSYTLSRTILRERF